MSTSIQHSFRLSSQTSELLDATARLGNESRNALADRLIGEGLRMERHPLVRFRTGAAGRREPIMVGTRLLVRQLVASVKAEDGYVDGVADSLGVSPAVVRAAVSYYADFAAEIDADQEWADAVAEAELARWNRERAAIA